VCRPPVLGILDAEPLPEEAVEPAVALLGIGFGAGLVTFSADDQNPLSVVAGR
jgi:hypothetical protein